MKFTKKFASSVFIIYLPQDIGVRADAWRQLFDVLHNSYDVVGLLSAYARMEFFQDEFPALVVRRYYALEHITICNMFHTYLHVSRINSKTIAYLAAAGELSKADLLLQHIRRAQHSASSEFDFLSMVANECSRENIVHFAPGTA
jgi:hypothetical protein